MAPIAIETTDPLPIDIKIKDVALPRKDTLNLPQTARDRLTKAGIDLTNGYPYRPARPLYLQDAFDIRNEPWVHDDAGARAAKTDVTKSSLLNAATKVTHLTGHIGTEIEGLQLKDLTSQQRDELALLIAERSVVFFRDQHLTPQQQKALGEYYGTIEVHPQVGKRLHISPNNRMTNTVTGTTSSRYTWCDRDMASIAGNRAACQFPQPRWC